MAAYEDTFYYLWRERRLPVNVDPLDSKIEDPVERNRMARIFEQELGKTIGFVLPLRRVPTKSGTPLDQSAVVHRIAPSVPGPRRFAARFAAASRIASLD